MTEAQLKLWKEMLNSELNSEYFAETASSLAKWDLRTKVFLAVMSSGTVAGWGFWNDAVQYPVLSIVWKVLSGIAALTSIALPLLNLTKKVEWAMTLKNAFGAASNEYENLWIRRKEFSDATLLLKMTLIRKKESDLAPVEDHFPVRDKTLLGLCQQTIVNRRGLAPSPS